jgi:ribonuclease E
MRRDTENEESSNTRMNEEPKDQHWAELADELGAEPTEVESSPDDDDDSATSELNVAFDAVEATAKMPDQPTGDWNSLANALGLEPQETTEAVAPSESEVGGQSEGDEEPSDQLVIEPESVPSELPGTQDREIDESSLAEVEFADESDSISEEATEAPESEEEKPPQRRRRRRRRSGRGRKTENGDSPNDAGGSSSTENVTDEVELIEDAELVADDSVQESDSQSSEADGEPDEPEGDRKRRKRRRRGRRGSRREPELTADSDDSEPTDDNEEAEVDSTDPKDQSDNSDPDQRKSGHRNIPTWDEAVGMVIAPNLDARTKDSTSTGGKSRGRGGRGRGRKSTKRS